MCSLSIKELVYALFTFFTLLSTLRTTLTGIVSSPDKRKRQICTEEPKHAVCGAEDSLNHGRGHPQRYECRYLQPHHGENGSCSKTTDEPLQREGVAPEGGGDDAIN